MAGMFYTLEEVMKKLAKSEEQVKGFVREGKLREFRDGAKQLYKVEDVDALKEADSGEVSITDDTLEMSIDETGEISLAPEELEALSSEESSGADFMKLDETGELLADEVLGDTSGISLEDTTGKPDESKETPDTKIPVAEKGDAEEIGLAAEGKDSLVVPSESEAEELSVDDTKLSETLGSSINVLGDSDPGFKLSEDTSGETKIVPSGDASLEGGIGEEEELSVSRLDDDVNLDSFGGSGSGLLDLSLQADDTSLGAVLDDIYPESGQAGAGGAGQSPVAGVGFEAEADKMMEEAAEGPAVSAAMPQNESAAAGRMVYAEPVPDTVSNMFGVILFLPLIVLIYAAIVILSAYRPIQNLNILSSIEGIIWYVLGGIGGVVILMVVIASVMGSGGSTGTKIKKEKAPKKPKKAKKVKAEKPKKAGKGKAADDYQE